MVYKIIKPAVINAQSYAWDIAKRSWKFWAFVVVSFSAALYFFNVFALLPILFYYMFMVNKYRDIFWKQLAECNGWEYKGVSGSDIEKGIMFKQGNRESVTSNNIKGSIEGRNFRSFNYEFSIGSGKSKQYYLYTVFSFKFNGNFPHIYLNYKKNSYAINIGEQISLPVEFEKEFILSVPKKYEIEALEIFTPDILSNFLDKEFFNDIEFVDQKLLIFVEGIYDFDKFEKEFQKALALVDLLDEKLDKFKFEEIGNMPSQFK